MLKQDYVKQSIKKKWTKNNHLKIKFKIFGLNKNFKKNIEFDD